VEQLKAAMGRCDASGSETLLNAGVNPSAPLYVSFLDLAIRCDDPKLVALLLRHGADPNQQSMGGLPLEAAAARGQIESMKLLLNKARACRLGERLQSAVRRHRKVL
jgi:ankyrin repeat protein